MRFFLHRFQIAHIYTTSTRHIYPWTEIEVTQEYAYSTAVQLCKKPIWHAAYRVNCSIYSVLDCLPKVLCYVYQTSKELESENNVLWNCLDVRMEQVTVIFYAPAIYYPWTEIEVTQEYAYSTSVLWTLRTWRPRGLPQEQDPRQGEYSSMERPLP